MRCYEGGLVFNFTPTDQIKQINQIYHHPNNFKWADEGRDFEITENPNWIHFNIEEDGISYGLITLKRMTDTDYEIHMAPLPNLFGNAVRMGAELLVCLARLIPDTTLWTYIAPQNRLAVRMMSRLGFIPKAHNIYQRGLKWVE